MEYIEREKVMAVLCNEIVGNGDYYNGKDDMQDEIRDMVSQLPSADVAPVRHGKWIERKSIHADGGISAKCSACQKDVQYLGNPLKYCPNCGAKMDGGTRNEQS